MANVFFLVLRVLVIFCSIGLAVQTCSGNGCQCSFDDESAFKSKSEILAAAVGALSPLLAAGGGFGIWKLIQSKMSDTASGLSREGSNLSSGSSRKSGSVSPETNSTRTSMDSRLSRSTPLTLKDMDLEDELDFPESPTPTEFDTRDGISSPKWSNSRQPPPSLMNRTPISAKPDELNSWMF